MGHELPKVTGVYMRGRYPAGTTPPWLQTKMLPEAPERPHLLTETSATVEAEIIEKDA